MPTVSLTIHECTTTTRRLHDGTTYLVVNKTKGWALTLSTVQTKYSSKPLPSVSAATSDAKNAPPNKTDRNHPEVDSGSG